MKRAMILGLGVSFMVAATVGFGQLTRAVPASKPASATAAGVVSSAPATQPLTGMMKFQFENASIDTVLKEMSARFGFVIQRVVPLTGNISVLAPQPVDEDEAITLLNSLLMPLGYGVVEKPAQEQLDGRMARVLRVMRWADAKKEAPVRGAEK